MSKSKCAESESAEYGLTKKSLAESEGRGRAVPTEYLSTILFCPSMLSRFPFESRLWQSVSGVPTNGDITMNIEINREIGRIGNGNDTQTLTVTRSVKPDVPVSRKKHHTHYTPTTHTVLILGNIHTLHTHHTVGVRWSA